MQQEFSHIDMGRLEVLISFNMFGTRLVWPSSCVKKSWTHRVLVIAHKYVSTSRPILKEICIKYRCNTEYPALNQFQYLSKDVRVHLEPFASKNLNGVLTISISIFTPHLRHTKIIKIDNFVDTIYHNKTETFVNISIPSHTKWAWEQGSSQNNRKGLPQYITQLLFIFHSP